MTKNDFLPTNRQDMEKRGWDQLDFLYICGDAYVDHPSSGHAIIMRVLESKGYRVGIIAQPNWQGSKNCRKRRPYRLRTKMSFKTTKGE